MMALWKARGGKLKQRVRFERMALRKEGKGGEV